MRKHINYMHCKHSLLHRDYIIFFDVQDKKKDFLYKQNSKKNHIDLMKCKDINQWFKHVHVDSKCTLSSRFMTFN